MPVARIQRIIPMSTSGTHHFIERTYREGGTFQWVRETFTNAMEADATRVEFGVEWQAVETSGVYRRLIADNGCGMTATQLVEFFNTFGGGGKPIGGLHENFGVGAKTALLPWNPYGVVVVSWVDGDASMIWMQRDPQSGEYGLRVEEVEDENGDISLEAVYEPYDDEEHGCNWAALKPDWINLHGTVIVLLGDGATQDTVLGDPSRDEADIKGVSAYLNRRIWKMPSDVEIYVDELRTQDRADWPRNEAMAHGHQGKRGPDRRTNTRMVQGALYFIEYPATGFKAGKLTAMGSVPTNDGTVIEWYLWDGERPAVQSYAAIGGYIAALYKNELYDVTAHHSVYRSFGVSEAVVRQRLWLILRPPVLGETEKHGVYPRTDRNALLLRGGPNAGGPLPISEWANEFAMNLPEELLQAIRAARSGDAGTIDDQTWRERLAERFGSRWRITKLRASRSGPVTTTPVQPGNTKKIRRIKRKQKSGGGGGGTGGVSGRATLGNVAGNAPAKAVKVAGGLPHYRLVRGADLAPGMIAAWHPNDPEYAQGVVLINVDHPVIESEITHWQGQFADHYADDVRKDVLAAYGEIAVAKIAHSEYLRGIVPSATVETELRSEGALTMSLLGLIAEEAVLAPRLGGKYGRRRAAV